jgi:hypothetical protein
MFSFSQNGGNENFAGLYLSYGRLHFRATTSLVRESVFPANVANMHQNVQLGLLRELLRQFGRLRELWWEPAEYVQEQIPTRLGLFDPIFEAATRDSRFRHTQRGS